MGRPPLELPNSIDARLVQANTRLAIASLGENVVVVPSAQKGALENMDSIEKAGHSHGRGGVKELDQESQTVPPQSAIDYEAYPEPTETERTTLRKVFDTIPLTAWTLCFVEVGERASYYGVRAAFNNFMQFPLPDGGPGTGAINPNNPNDHAGALLVFCFALFCFVLLLVFFSNRDPPRAGGIITSANQPL